MFAEQKKLRGRELRWKQILENKPQTGSFSQSDLARAPASKHILRAVCLANCFLSSRGMEILQAPCHLFQSHFLLHLEVLAFKEWRQERGGQEIEWQRGDK